MKQMASSVYEKKRVSYIHINPASCIYFLIVNCEDIFNKIHNYKNTFYIE